MTLIASLVVTILFELDRARSALSTQKKLKFHVSNNGVLYVPHDAANGSRLRLANEIRAARTAVDSNRTLLPAIAADSMPHRKDTGAGFYEAFPVLLAREQDFGKS